MSSIVRSGPYTPSNMQEAEQLSVRLAQSALLPDGLRGKPNDVLVTLITGHELGLSPMQAIRGLHVVKGRAVMSADMAVALTKQHPSCRFFRLVSSDDRAAVYETHREGDPEPTRMSFTAEQARTAGLGGDNWKKFPSAMLRARCSLALARAVYPDIMLGVYDPDELGVSAPSPVPMMEERTVAPPPPAVVAPTPEHAKPKREQAPKAKAAPAPRVVEAEVVPMRSGNAAVKSKVMQALGWSPEPQPEEPPAPEMEPVELEVEPDLSPAEQVLARIAEAQTLADLAPVVKAITEHGLTKDAGIRQAYQAKQRDLRQGVR
jgi:hypothetical protein